MGKKNFFNSCFHFSLFSFLRKNGEGKKKEKKNKKEEREKGREKEKTAGYSAVKWRNNQPSEDFRVLIAVSRNYTASLGAKIRKK